MVRMKYLILDVRKLSQYDTLNIKLAENSNNMNPNILFASPRLMKNTKARIKDTKAKKTKMIIQNKDIIMDV